jgi:hypothetical protein
MTLKVQSLFRFDGGFKSAAVTRGLAVDNVKLRLETYFFAVNYILG